jgi:short-subunit dehydrogenase
MASKFKAKPIDQQTIVMTGTSAIGLAVARLAAEKGARVVLGGRSDTELQNISEEVSRAGGHILTVKTDVTKRSDLERLCEKATEHFGQIDTWINNAGSSIYGYLLDTDIADEKKLFDINFWGARLGSHIGVLAMKSHGGVLINMGSEVSVTAQPLLGMYAATKQAIKAFTDALRSELRDKDLPIEVCLVRPTSIESEGADLAATAIIKCAENPQRDVYVGGPARLSAIIDTFFPTVKDMMTESKMKELKSSTH